MSDSVYSCAEFYFLDGNLNILYVDGEGNPRSVTMKLKEEEEELAKLTLSDINFWTTIVNALSASLTQHR